MLEKRIIIFDDDEDILEVLSLILTCKGFLVKTFASGAMALQAIKNFSPHLILMDVMLGPMDGRLICKQLKQVHEVSELPLILLSASHNLSLSLQQQGAPNDFIAKPFDIDELLTKIELQLTN